MISWLRGNDYFGYQRYPLVIKHGNGTWTIEVGTFPIKTSVQFGMFHCHVWLPEGNLWCLYHETPDLKIPSHETWASPRQPQWWKRRFQIYQECLICVEFSLGIHVFSSKKYLGNPWHISIQWTGLWKRDAIISPKILTIRQARAWSNAIAISLPQQVALQSVSQIGDVSTKNKASG